MRSGRLGYTHTCSHRIQMSTVGKAQRGACSAQSCQHAPLGWSEIVREMVRGLGRYFNTENDLVDGATPQWGATMQASLNWPGTPILLRVISAAFAARSKLQKRGHFASGTSAHMRTQLSSAVHHCCLQRRSSTITCLQMALRRCYVQPSMAGR